MHAPPQAPWTAATVAAWLRERDPRALETLWRTADRIRRECVGDAVHLRGLIELSNHCRQACVYCGINAARRGLERYRMTPGEILDTARLAHTFGYGTVVLQAGEDPGITRDGMADTVRRIKGETGLAVTLSLGERTPDALATWREAGADRYLLRFETSDTALYHRLHAPGRPAPETHPRLALLAELRRLGYETGGGVMIGLPGQTVDTLARDILTFRDLDMDMVGVGPYLAHPGAAAIAPEPAADGQVPVDDRVVYTVIALTRLLCPEANIPCTTAVATLDPAAGRRLGLSRGANVVMPNLTPMRYRPLYDIYPAKAGRDQTPDAMHAEVLHDLAAIGRRAATGPGGRRRGGLARNSPSGYSEQKRPARAQ
jgi:biotin synthase